MTIKKQIMYNIKEKLKIGIIGFGRMGQKYGKEIIKHPLLDLVYICDSCAKAREIASETFPDVKIIDSEDPIFADSEIDIVGLFTLADSRPEQIRKAIKTGKHVLAEKPVAEDIRVDVARWYAGSDYATYHAQGVRMWSYADPWWLQVHGTFQNGVVFDITQGCTLCGTAMVCLYPPESY
jgi:hypothetical protein